MGQLLADGRDSGVKQLLMMRGSEFLHILLLCSFLLLRMVVNLELFNESFLYYLGSVFRIAKICNSAFINRAKDK